MDDSEIFLIGFLVVILIGATMFGLGASGPVGSIFRAFTNAFGAIGLTNSTSCGFYRSVGAIPVWACIFIFGLVPFIIVYYFTFDSLSFTFMSTRTKSMIALASALIASIPFGGGTIIAQLNDVVFNVTSFTFNRQYGFFFIILVLGFLAAFFGQIAITSQMAGAATRSLQETFWGFRAMNQIGREMTRERP